MRSRYAAYAVGELDHVFRTWHPRTRPLSIEPDPALTWTGLSVLDVVDGGRVTRPARSSSRRRTTAAAARAGGTSAAGSSAAAGAGSTWTETSARSRRARRRC